MNITERKGILNAREEWGKMRYVCEKKKNVQSKIESSALTTPALVYQLFGTRNF